MISLCFDPLFDLECGSAFRNQSTAGVRAGCGCGEMRCKPTSPYMDLEHQITIVCQGLTHNISLDRSPGSEIQRSLGGGGDSYHGGGNFIGPSNVEGVGGWF